MLWKSRWALLFLTLSYGTLHAQGDPESLVNWLSLKEAQEKNRQQQKPLLIDFYTDWCGWCKHMMKTTYSNPGIAGYINANFYPVKFNAECKDTVEYNGKVYKPLSAEPKTPHEFAVKFLGNQLSYPSTVFITNNYEFSMLSNGYLDEKKIEPMLVFMVENAWRSSVYEEFARHFNHAFYDTAYKKLPVKLHTFQEVQKLMQKKPKKVLVNMNASFCNTCKVMQKTTFTDTSIAAMINKYYYVVNFNVEQEDTIVFQNQKYYKTLVNGYPMNSLVLKLSNNRFALPTLCFLDEKMTTLDALNFYQSPEHIKPVIEYFGADFYKKKSWQDFIKEYSARPKSAAIK